MLFWFVCVGFVIFVWVCFGSIDLLDCFDLVDLGLCVVILFGLCSLVCLWLTILILILMVELFD